MKNTLLLIALMTVTLIACDEPATGSDNDTDNTQIQSEVSEPNEGWGIHETPSYTLPYPEQGWVVDNSGLMGSSVFLFKETNSDFRNNVMFLLKTLQVRILT